MNYYKCGLKESKIIGNFEIAKWITPRNPLSKALLVTFRQLIPPEYVDISGEQARSKVYEYHDKPMMCKKYLEYNHTAKRCTYTDVVCAKCASKGHDIKSCQSELSKCYHCGNNQRADDRKCAVQHEHEEIIIIRTRMQITIEQAKLIYHQQNPQYPKTLCRSDPSKEIRC